MFWFVYLFFGFFGRWLLVVGYLTGPSGTYTVRFVCDGVWSSTISTVQVTSSVHAVVVLNKHVAIPLAHQFVLSSEGDGNVVQKVAKFILRALDNKGNGVAGKIVQVELYKNDTGTLVLEDPAIAGIALQTPKDK